MQIPDIDENWRWKLKMSGAKAKNVVEENALVWGKILIDQEIQIICGLGLASFFYFVDRG